MAVWALRINTVALGLAMLAGMIVPAMPPWWTPVVGTMAGVYFAQVGVVKGKAQASAAELVKSAPLSLVKAEPPAEVRDWCQGCGNVPIRRLMGWTESGLYRCRSCRGH